MSFDEFALENDELDDAEAGFGDEEEDEDTEEGDSSEDTEEEM